jgi:hypothetical protein
LESINYDLRSEGENICTNICKSVKLFYGFKSTLTYFKITLYPTWLEPGGGRDGGKFFPKYHMVMLSISKIYFT